MRAALASPLLLLALLASPAWCTLAPHPRLILTEARLVEVQAAIASAPQAAAYYASLLAQGEYTLPRPLIPPPAANASSILMQARAVLTRTYVTALLYRLTGNET